MRRRDFALALAAVPVVMQPASAEATGVRLGKSYGLPYVPNMIMEKMQLVEKHAARAGLPHLDVSWTTMASTGASNDALLAGQIDFVSAGSPSLIQLWEKTVGTPQAILGLSSLQSEPFVLMTRNPAVKSVKDFTDKDRIAVNTAKLSAQAICLEMAAAQAFGFDQWEKLDPYTVTLSNPDALIAVMNGGNAVNTHYAVAPYYYYEQANKDLHQVLKSYDTLGGKHTNGLFIGNKRFWDANPKICQIVFEAQTEANAWIKAHPRDAAQIYQDMTGDKHDPVDMVAKMVSDPDNDYTTTPRQVMKFAEFMNKIGRTKKLPASWKDMFMPPAQGLPGS